jgi:nucleotide-binding universal stress UspA family protein
MRTTSAPDGKALIAAVVARPYVVGMRILAAVDRSEYSEIVLEHALDQFVRGPDSGGELHVLTVVANDAEVEPARRELDRIVSEGLDAFGVSGHAVALHVRRGRVAPAIAALAAELAVDLLVIGRFYHHAPVESTSDVVLAIAECPTLVVGIEGHVLEPQCMACREVRRETNGEQLFCADHANQRMPELVTRLPSSTSLGSRLW